MQRPPQWEEVHELWRRSEDLRLGLAKEYNKSISKTNERDQRTASQAQQELVRNRVFSISIGLLQCYIPVPKGFS
jgi:hypothetical protein